eukprot:CAMPEP_0178812892 /NCGR_PEP_ID=MMETSP0745-20121128/20074_1 /TAXON_ID=913974 /ORGANISM="Nitzschia punctata, Strain CCMP561" /LENGTH=35 /DNA_ID= /DNA_START= /DNA_END= /DNA_ORIENTATION=
MTNIPVYDVDPRLYMHLLSVHCVNSDRVRILHPEP